MKTLAMTTIVDAIHAGGISKRGNIIIKAKSLQKNSAKTPIMQRTHLTIPPAM
jgi:hypothetical protein